MMKTIHLEIANRKMEWNIPIPFDPYTGPIRSFVTIQLIKRAMPQDKGILVTTQPNELRNPLYWCYFGLFHWSDIQTQGW